MAPMKHTTPWLEAVVAAVTPLIEAAALERAAKVAEEEGSDFDTCKEIAAAIRALKQPSP